MNEFFLNDYYRATGREWKAIKFLRLLEKPGLRYLYFLRKEQCAKYSLESWVFRRNRMRIQLKFGLEINSLQIQKGCVIEHPYNIAINKHVKIGVNFCVTKGVTIGKDFRGKRKGTPIIGNYVFVGANATLVGNIVIGNDVLIAPNSYVNIDIPDHSIVLGAPCKIIPCEKATEGFINNLKP